MYSVVGDVWETRSGNAAHTCAGRKWSLRIKEGLNLASRARTAWRSYDELRSLRPHHRWKCCTVLYRIGIVAWQTWKPAPAVPVQYCIRTRTV